jgi:hypothetical protein
VFTRDCGATTDYSTQVTLVRAGATVPNKPGSVLVAAHSTDVRVAWIGPDTLLVQHATTAPNLKAESVDGVAVRYGSLP